jgi:hypothetical protein
VTVARSASAVGARELAFGQYQSNSASNLDLDGDGLVDFVDARENLQSTTPSGLAQTFVPLPGSAIFNGTYSIPGTTADLTGAVMLATSNWDSRDLRYYGYTVGNFGLRTDFGVTADTVVGVRFRAADGLHYGWLPIRVFRFAPPDRTIFVRFDPAVWNPWPNEGMTVGEPAPGVLRMTANRGEAPVVSWPPGVAGVLEEKSLAPGAAWQPVAPAVPPTSGRYVPGLRGPGMLYRLR